jgi:hypothetical protein
VLFFRYFGTDISDQQQQRDFEELMGHLFGAAGAFFISDFIPYLLFVEKLRGTIKKLEAIRGFLRRVLGKVFEVEKHRQRALENGQDANYVPDFVDVLLKTPLDDGEQFTDGEIISILSVRSSCIRFMSKLSARHSRAWLPLTLRICARA